MEPSGLTKNVLTVGFRVLLCKATFFLTKRVTDSLLYFCKSSKFQNLPLYHLLLEEPKTSKSSFDPVWSLTPWWRRALGKFRSLQV
jgi:hypothetical protein